MSQGSEKGRSPVSTLNGAPSYCDLQTLEMTQRLLAVLSSAFGCCPQRGGSGSVKVATSVRRPRKAAVIAFLGRRGCLSLVKLQLASSVLDRAHRKLEAWRAGGPKHFSQSPRVTAPDRAQLVGGDVIVWKSWSWARNLMALLCSYLLSS